MAPRALLVVLLWCALPVMPALAGDALLSVPSRSLAQHDQCADVGPGRARCLSVELTTRTGEPATPANLGTAGAVSPATPTPPSGYGPADLQDAYGLGGLLAGGTGKTIAIVDAYDSPTAEADLGVYRAQYGLPACTTANGCFRKVNQAGVAGSYPATDTGWAGEIALDIEMASAVCPACHILLVAASSNNTDDLYASVNRAVTLGATVVSNSYGGDEYPEETGTDAAAFDHPGVPIFASAGDSGYGAESPASYATVVAVGGTKLVPAATTRGWDETVWGAATTGADGTGSGCSAFIPRPAWQPVVSGCLKRSVADVSAVADPRTGVAVYNTTGDTGWIVLGGTSVASPVVASVWALLGSAASAGSSWAYARPADFHDVIAGTNSSALTCVVLLCTAAIGYDGPSGLGTPDGVALKADLAGGTGGGGGGGGGGSGGGGGGGGSTTVTTPDPTDGTVITPPVSSPGTGLQPLATPAAKRSPDVRITGARRTPSTVRVGGSIDGAATGGVTLTYWAVVRGKVVSRQVAGTIAAGRFRAVLTVTGALANAAKGVVTVTYRGDDAFAAGGAQQGLDRPTR